MPSAFAHALAAGAIGAAFYRPRLPLRFWVLGVACAVLPDADVVGTAAGISVWHVLGHRGLSHSLVFAAALAAVIVAVFFPRAPAGTSRSRLWIYFFLATASHGVLDAFTNGGPGVAFFAPVDEGRYFFPVRPIQVSPLGIRPFFSEWGRRVIASEAVWIGVPALALVLACGWWRRATRAGAGGRPRR